MSADSILSHATRRVVLDACMDGRTEEVTLSPAEAAELPPNLLPSWKAEETSNDDQTVFSPRTNNPSELKDHINANERQRLSRIRVHTYVSNVVKDAEGSDEQSLAGSQVLTEVDSQENGTTSTEKKWVFQNRLKTKLNQN